MRSRERIRMAKFALVGALNTGVDFAVFVLLIYGFGCVPWLAQTLSYGCGVANSYWLNRRWTFRLHGRIRWHEPVRFAVVNGVSFLSATAVLLILHHELGWLPWIAKVASIAASMIVNYAGSRYWVFGKATNP